MKPSRLLLWLGTALAAFCCAPLFAQESVPASADTAMTAPTRLKAGDVAPDFTVYGPDGKAVKLSDFRGQLVMLDIWATWCGPCVASMPHNSELAEKFAKDGFVILAVCASDARENYDDWVKRNGTKYKFLTAHDKAGKDWKESVFNTQYGVTGFPSIYLIGRDGKIVGITGGGGPKENPHVTRLLAKGGLPIDTSHLPPEEKNAPKSIPALAKTAAMPAGMGAATAAPTSPRDIVPKKFGSVAAGEMVPDFTVTGVDGKDVKPSAFLGKPLAMHFVTSGGPQPWFLDILKTYQAQGLAALVVFSATERADFDAWLAKNPERSYAVAWDPAGKAWGESALNTNFGVGMFPATAVVAADGKLVSGIIGMGDRVAVTVKMMLLGTRTIKPSDDDLAAIRTYVQSVMGSGGMRAATANAPAAGAAAAAPKPALLGAGTLAPDFEMLDVAGKKVKLSDFKGQVVILDFWATWCGPCIASFPHAQEIAAKYKDQGVIFLASGTSDTIAKFKEWIPKNQPKYPDLQFYFDPNERDSATFDQRAASKLYHVSGIPTQFVIGGDGKIAAAIVGNGGKEDKRTEAALASVGVKVDAEIVAKGEAALKRDAEKAVAAAAAAKEEEANPKPAFRESFGKLKAGVAVPDFTVQTVEGSAAQFSAVTKGKTVVLGIWTAGNGPGDQTLAMMSAWQSKYADQGVVFLGIGAYDGREAFDEWRAKNEAKIGFTIAFDPAGKAPRAPKPMEEMTEEEKSAHKAAAGAYYAKVIPMFLSGGAMAPVPNTTVIDSQGRMVGFWAGAGGNSVASLGNLLLRAGIKLAPEDMPPKVFTAADTKEAPPEARVATIKIGAMAPDFTTQTLDGKDVKISDFKGKVVILDFWATWCGPCMAAMPHTQEVAAHYKDQGVVVLGSCTSDGRAAFERWVKANQEKYSDIVWSHDKAERGADRASRKLYGVAGIPTQFILDRDGKIVDIVVGYMPGEAILDGALAKAGVKVDPALVEKAKADLAKRANR